MSWSIVPWMQSVCTSSKAQTPLLYTAQLSLIIMCPMEWSGDGLCALVCAALNRLIYLCRSVSLYAWYDSPLVHKGLRKPLGGPTSFYFEVSYHRHCTCLKYTLYMMSLITVPMDLQYLHTNLAVYYWNTRIDASDLMCLFFILFTWL